MFCGMDIRYTALGRGKELRVYLPCARGYSYHSGAGAARMHYPYGCRRHGLDSSGVGNFRNAQFQRAEKGRAITQIAVGSGPCLEVVKKTERYQWDAVRRIPLFLWLAFGIRGQLAL